MPRHRRQQVQDQSGRLTLILTLNLTLTLTLTLFQAQLAELATLLAASDCFFIRCIKPNPLTLT